jgi:hypothetical protein
VTVPVRGIMVGSPGGGTRCEFGMQLTVPPRTFGSGIGHPESATGGGAAAGAGVGVLTDVVVPKIQPT